MLRLFFHFGAGQTYTSHQIHSTHTKVLSQSILSGVMPGSSVWPCISLYFSQRFRELVTCEINSINSLIGIQTISPTPCLF